MTPGQHPIRRRAILSPRSAVTSISDVPFGMLGTGSLLLLRLGLSNGSEVDECVVRVVDPLSQRSRCRHTLPVLPHFPAGMLLLLS